LTIVLALFVAGCGRSAPHETAPVSGTVTFAGKPLPGGTIGFHPKGKGNPGFGEIKDGKFKITTYTAYDGAVLGEHVVTVEVFGGQDEPPPLPGTEGKTGKVPRRYADVKTSPLRFTVNAGENTASFPLEP
jgi:hypothetical protein